MIVSYSTIEDLGAGFRSRLFLPRWKSAQELLKAVAYERLRVLRARIVIGHVEQGRDIKGFEEAHKFVVETRIPIDEFQQLSIGEKNDLVFDSIFESIKAAYAHFGDTPPPKIDRIWQEVRATGK
jgi:hypothetical protein